MTAYTLARELEKACKELSDVADVEFRDFPDKPSRMDLFDQWALLSSSEFFFLLQSHKPISDDDANLVDALDTLWKDDNIRLQLIEELDRIYIIRNHMPFLKSARDWCLTRQGTFRTAHKEMLNQRQEAVKVLYGQCKGEFRRVLKSRNDSSFVIAAVDDYTTKRKDRDTWVQRAKHLVAQVDDYWAQEKIPVPSQWQDAPGGPSPAW